LAAPKILPLGIASLKKVFFALLSARLFVSLQAESGGESLEGRLTKRMSSDDGGVEVALQVLELVAQGDEGLEDIVGTVDTLAVLVEILAGCGQLEAAHLHEVVDEAHLLDVLLRVLAHASGTDGLRAQMGELFLPVAQQALVDTQHLGHFLDAIVEFEVLIWIQCHVDIYVLLFYAFFSCLMVFLPPFAVIWGKDSNKN